MDDDETMTEAEIDAEFERTRPIGHAINALAQAELAVAAVDELDSATAERLDRIRLSALAAFEKETTMNDSQPVPDWASAPLRRIWPTLSGDEQAALIGDRENALLRQAAVSVRRTDSAMSLGARPGGMFALDDFPDHKWHAERFEEPWNGWATPVVNRETVENLFEDLREHGNPGTVGPNGTVTVYRDSDDDGDFEIRADESGLYHLYELGWTFVEVD